MNPFDIIKSILASACLAAVVWAGISYVHTKEELASLQAVIEQADAQAHATQIHQEQTFKEVQNENDSNRDTLVSYYDSLLRSKTTTGKNAKRSQRLDATSGERVACEPDTGFERACALDANKVMMWQAWAIKNGIPVQ